MNRAFQIFWALLKPIYKFISFVLTAIFILGGIVVITLVLIFRNNIINTLTESTAKPLPESTKDGVYLYLNLGKIVEKPSVLPPYTNLARNLGIYLPTITSTSDLKKVFDYATKDKRVKGIIFNSTDADYANIDIADQIDNLIVHYKQATKNPVYSYATFQTIADILSFRHANKIFVGAFGGFEANFPTIDSFFFKDFFKEYGIADYSNKIGKYSLANLWTQSSFTPDNKNSIDAIVWKPYQIMLDNINQARNTKLTLDTFSPQATIKASFDLKSTADYDKEVGIDNEVFTPTQWSDFIRDTAGVDPETKSPKIVSFGRYLSDIQYQEEHKPVKDNKNNDYYLTFYYSGYLAQNSINANIVADTLLDRTLYNNNKKGGKLRGIVLRLNSPGGDVASANVLYKTIKQIQDSGIPVVISSPETLTGAAYIAASAANGIIVGQYSSVGGIDASYTLVDVTDLLRAFYNINPSYFRSTRLVVGNGEVPFPFNLLVQLPTVTVVTPEFVAYKNLLLENNYKQSIDLIAKGRNLPVEQVDKLSQGLVYTAKEALAAKLINGIGSLNDAYAFLDKLNQEKDKNFNSTNIQHYTGNPYYVGGSSILSVINNQIAAYKSFEVRSELNLTPSQYDSLLFTTQANQQGIVSVCTACDNKSPSRTKLPKNSKFGYERFSLFDTNQPWFSLDSK